MGLLTEETQSNKDCKILVDSKDDPKYKRYLIEYKVYMEGYKFTKSLGFPQVTNINDYDYFSTGFIENRPWFGYEQTYKEYFNENSVASSTKDRFNRDKAIKIVQNNIQKYGIKPKSLAYKDIMFPAYLKPKKVCVKKPTPFVSPTTTQTTTPPQEPSPSLRPNPVTKFSVSWREDTPSGEVNQNTHYFSNYDEWKEFVNQYPNTVSQNENGSKTEAQALYSGLHADISKDKIVKGPR